MFCQPFQWIIIALADFFGWIMDSLCTRQSVLIGFDRVENEQSIYQINVCVCDTWAWTTLRRLRVYLNTNKSSVRKVQCRTLLVKMCVAYGRFF